MDEPTAALSGHEVERLFGVVRTLRERGAAVLFISPPPRRDLRDLRHGHRPARRRGHARRHDRGHGHRRARPPHGRPRALQLFPKLDAKIGETVLEVDAAHARGRVHRRLLRGPPRRDRRARRPRRRGPQRGRARDLRRRHARTPATSPSTASSSSPARPSAAMKAGIGLVPEDRRQQGLVMELSHRAQHRPHAPAGAAQPARRDRRRRRGQARHRLGDQAAAQVPPAAPTPSASCRAATSRRSCSASGSPPARRS